MSDEKLFFDADDLDARKFDAANDLGEPGRFPFTRGPQRSMYRGKLWTMRQYAGFSTAAESNKRYRYLLERGTTGLSVAFDLPTQIGMDSDDPRARGEVGNVGVAIDSIEDMERLFDSIPLDRVSISMTINAPASILLALLLVVAERRGIAWTKLNGTIQNDILKEYAARGTYIFPPAPSLRIVTDIFEFCAAEVPRWNTISVSGYHIREAGSTAVQEVAFTLANGLEYVRAAVERGLDVDSFAPRMSFFFNAHNDFLEEVAKFRAARKLWATLMRERHAPKDPRSLALRFHSQTAGSTLTAQQPENKSASVIGVNEFVDGTSAPLPIMVIDESVERDQVTRLHAFREKRTGDVAPMLAALDTAAREGGNLMPPIVDCVRNDCTVGEIVATLKKNFGEHT